jgi:hypothetical protein
MSFWKRLFGTQQPPAPKWEYLIRFRDGGSYTYLGSGVAQRPVSDPRYAWKNQEDTLHQIVAFLKMDKKSLHHEMGKSITGRGARREAQVWTAFCRNVAFSRKEQNVIGESLLRTAEVVSFDEACRDYSMSHPQPATRIQESSVTASMSGDIQLMVQGTGNTVGQDTEADRQAIIGALTCLDARYASDIRPENVRIKFRACPDEPTDFVVYLTVSVPKERAFSIQRDLVAELARAGLKV